MTAPKYLTVAELRKLLSQLEDHERLWPNALGNLSVIDNKWRPYASIDFATGTVYYFDQRNNFDPPWSLPKRR